MCKDASKPVDVVKRFSELWEQSDPHPDVFSYLDQQNVCEIATVGSVLLIDQYQRWSRGIEMPVEEYFRRVPRLMSDESLQLQLIEEELGHLEERGKFPKREEVQDRFNQLSATLLQRILEGLDVSWSDEDSLNSISSLVLGTHDPTSIPDSVGRYEIQSKLGGGSFGEVYLAFDPELGRSVAVKVPRRGRIRQIEKIEAFKNEARILAQLDHPNIVPVYDFGVVDGLCFVISKYIKGDNLHNVRNGRITQREATQLIATIARALDHAHQRGLVHRDVKPANILVDRQRCPYVTDFGLAMRDDEFGSGCGFVGTPAYMSPEQARGEGHRVDARSDIYSLGIVLVELLVGKRPYRKGTTSTLVDQIRAGNLRPPRQFNTAIPRVLDRICMKALARRASERYSTASDFAEDLEGFLQDSESDHDAFARSATRETQQNVSSTKIEGPHSLTDTGSSTSSLECGSAKAAVPIVPKGLRSFNETDAEFFLELLPGPRDRFGVPDSLRFWKHQIERQSSDSTFPVGLIYGPSGCGKSSFVQAGLIPLLSDDVSSIYVEATTSDTELRLLRGIRSLHPALPSDLTLKDSIVKLRKAAHRTGQKTLIIIDQFEQWLHAWHNDSDSPLVVSLRHCDGAYVQAILLIRDDFWMAATRFMRELEIPLVEHHNSAAVDLFDKRHAKRVVHAYGVAFGALPAGRDQLTSDQEQFLSAAVEGLAENGQVISVRLALFAEMIKGESWGMATLRRMGGSKGVGLAYLENTFGSTAAPQHKLHAKAARRVLATLLPVAASNIKGNMQPVSKIATAAGYGDQKDTSELLGILDNELRLITPTEPNRDLGSGSSDEVSADGVDDHPHEPFYQLTHDYLVPSVREWLDRDLKSTRAGRAELRLRDMSDIWNARPEKRLLPSAWECLQIITLTDSRRWAPTQARFMSAAKRQQCSRAVLFAIAGLIASILIYEMVGRSNARHQVERLLVAEINEVPQIIDLNAMPNRWLRRELRAVANDDSRSPNQRKNISIAMLKSDPNCVAFLANQIPAATADELSVIAAALLPYKKEAAAELWRSLRSTQGEARLNSAKALARLFPADERWRREADTIVGDVVSAPSDLRTNLTALEPIASFLIGPLLREARSADVARRRTAAEGVGTFIGTDDHRLLDLIEESDPEQFKILLPKLVARAEYFIPRLRDRWLRPRHKPWPKSGFEDRVSNEVSALITAAGGVIHAEFAFWFDMPFGRIDEVADVLKASKYRPLNVRPFRTSRGLRCSACWHRDDAEWFLDTDLTRKKLEESEARNRANGLLPDDVGCYFINDDANEPRFVAVWRRFENSNVRRSIYAGFDTKRHRLEQDRRQTDRLFERSRHLTTTPDGLFLQHSMVWALDDDNREDGFFYHCDEDEFMVVQRTQLLPTDYCVTRAVSDDGKRVYAHYSALWANRSDFFEAKASLAADLSAHLADAERFRQQGYRPVSISAADLGADDWRRTSVWHRPFMSPENKFQLARYRANCAAALFRLGSVSELLSGLCGKDQSEQLDVEGVLDGANRVDVTLQTELIHASHSHGCEISGLVAALRDADDAAALGLLLALGKYPLDTVEPETQVACLESVQSKYAQSHHAGLRSAAEWCLRRWGRIELLASGKENRTATPHPSDAVYTDLNGHTMHVFDRRHSQHAFRMGCPLSETGAFWEDRLHVKRIRRRFAMSSTEVTLGQFDSFLRARPEITYVGKRLGGDDMPATKTTWFLVALYCNWLSELHGVPKSEWCFDTYYDDNGALRIHLSPNYLSKTGYRLPTEAEWEYCCRAGTGTAFPFGETNHRLGHYAWFAENSGGRSHPVGERMPNAFGMFDMLGNVQEWCMERHEADLTRIRSIVNRDHEDQTVVERATFRLIRGGSFDSQSLSTRCGSREPLHGYKRRSTQGFRVVRTLESAE